MTVEHETRDSDNFTKILAFAFQCRTNDNQEAHGGDGRDTLIMLAKADAALPVSFVPDVAPAVAERTDDRWWTLDVRSIAMVFATNTALFCALDLAQWLADRYALSTLPTNLVAAAIATALGLVFAAQCFCGDPPSPARAVPRGEPFASRRPLVPRRLARAPAHAARSGNARTAALRLAGGERLRPSGVARHRRPPAPKT